MKRKMDVVILAGGKGSELWPLTQNRPKPMIKLLGKPVLQYIIENLKELGLDKIIIVIGYKGEQIRQYFKKGSDFGVNINYAHQKEEGIKAALLAAKSYLTSNEEFLLLFGDIIAEVGLIKRTLNAYENTQADMAMALTLQSQTGNFGVADIDYKGYIKSVTLDTKTNNTPSNTPSNYVDAGCFVLKTSVLDELEQQKNLPEALNSSIKKGSKVVAAIWEKEWVDIGKPWDIIKANRLLLDKVKESRIAKNVTIEANVVMKDVVIIEENTTISSGTVLHGPIYIGANSYIGNNVLIRDHSSIAENSLVGFGSEIKNSVLFSNAKIYRLCYVGDSIIGEKTVFSSGVLTVNTKTDLSEITMKINDKEVRTGLKKLGAVVGDNCTIGVNSLIFPGRKITSDSTVDPGTTIKDDLE